MSLENGLSVIVEELEVLQSIYMDDLIVQRDDSGHPKQICMQLHPATGDEINKKFVCITVLLDIPQQYPNELPEVTLKNPRGLGEEEVIRIKSAMLDLAKERQGGHMLYEMIELVVENLTQGNVPRCACTICYEHFTETDSFTRTICYHFFHVSCLDRYVRHELERREAEKEEAPVHSKQETPVSDKVPCPVCREEITLDRDELQRSLSIDEEETITYQPTPEIRKWQREMVELREKQKQKGGIIDMEEEKNKYLVTQDTVFVPISISPVPKEVDKEENKRNKGKGRGQPKDRDNYRSEDRRPYDRGKHNRFNDRDSRGKVYNRGYDYESKERARYNDARPRSGRGHTDGGNDRRYGGERNHGRRDYRYDREADRRQNRPGYNNNNKDDRKSENSDGIDRKGHKENDTRHKKIQEDVRFEENWSSKEHRKREDSNQQEGKTSEDNEPKHDEELASGGGKNNKVDHNTDRIDLTNDRKMNESGKAGKDDNKESNERDESSRKPSHNTNEETAGDEQYVRNGPQKASGTCISDSTKMKTESYNAKERCGFGRPKNDNQGKYSGRDRRSEQQVKYHRDDNRSSYNYYSKRDDKHDSEKRTNDGERKYERPSGGFGRPNTGDRERKDDDRKSGHTDADDKKGRSNNPISEYNNNRRPKSGHGRSGNYRNPRYAEQNHVRYYNDKPSKPRGGFGRPRQEFDRPREESGKPREDHDRSRQKCDISREECDLQREEHDRPREYHDRSRQKCDIPREECGSQKEEHNRPSEKNGNPREEHDRPRQVHDKPRNGFGRPKSGVKSRCENQPQNDSKSTKSNSEKNMVVKTQCDKPSGASNDVGYRGSKDSMQESDRVNVKNSSQDSHIHIGKGSSRTDFDIEKSENNVKNRRTPPGFKVKGLPPGFYMSTEKEVKPPPGFENNS